MPKVKARQRADRMRVSSSPSSHAAATSWSRANAAGTPICTRSAMCSWIALPIAAAGFVEVPCGSAVDPGKIRARPRLEPEV